MPEICRFFGIVIYIYYREHQPAHFHAVYGEFEALISIDSIAIISGTLPPRALGLVVEWANIYKEELKKDWIKAMALEKLDKIEPLK
jgi:hypothetical protein